jgi:hypothetical protein
MRVRNVALFVGMDSGFATCQALGCFEALTVMTRVWQAVAGVMLVAMTASAEEKPTFTFEAPKIAPGLWKDVDMLETEREEYATNLAASASNRVVTANASATSLQDAKRMLAVSLHLSPRNRKALVTIFQLGKGLLPEATEGDYSPQVFARLLLARGQSLEKQTSPENQSLGRVFIELAAQIDPKNEDAVYASEVNRLDHGAVDWNALMVKP